MLAEQSERTTANPQRGGCGVKTVLFHAQDDKSLDARLETALSLARGCGAHLTCLHVTPIEAYVAFDTFGGVFVMNDVIKALDEAEAQLRAKVEAQLGNEDVRWDYAQVTGNIGNKITAFAALADIVVTGRDPHKSDFPGPAIGLLGDLLNMSRTPLLIDGDEDGPFDPTGPALIAWNGSYEAANAVRSAIGLLKAASEVRVLTVNEDKAGAFPDTRLLAYLSRHDIAAELTQEPAAAGGGDPRGVTDRLVETARKVNAAYLVMGGYGRSRISEYVFGGVTRTLLGACPLPLVIAR